MTQVLEITAPSLDVLNYKLQKWQQFEGEDVIDILSVTQSPYNKDIYLVTYEKYDNEDNDDYEDYGSDDYDAE